MFKVLEPLFQKTDDQEEILGFLIIDLYFKHAIVTVSCRLAPRPAQTFVFKEQVCLYWSECFCILCMYLQKKISVVTYP